jgi:hypothetical protein
VDKIFEGFDELLEYDSRTYFMGFPLPDVVQGKLS